LLLTEPQTAHAVTWELLVEPRGRSGAENMSVDAALLAEADRTGRALLRLYRFDPPCLSLGRNEPAAARYDRAAIARLGLHVVRRPTGGTAVWHEHEVTYAVAAPVAAFGSLRNAYHTIHERIAAALRSLGANATLAPHQPPPSGRVDQPASCFATPVGGEVLVAGGKLVGSAQVRKRSAFLQHGSILLDGSQEIVRVVSRQTSAVSGETTLSGVLRRHVSFHEVADAIVAAWDDEVTSPNLHQPPPTSTTLLSHLAPLGVPVKS
jgi:lipoyl(octanoyl) transferase